MILCMSWIVSTMKSGFFCWNMKSWNPNDESAIPGQ